MGMVVLSVFEDLQHRMDTESFCGWERMPCTQRHPKDQGGALIGRGR